MASDQHLVLTKLKLKLKKSWSPLNTRVISLSNKYKILQDLLKDENMPMDEKWNHVKEALNTTVQCTCREVLGKKLFQQKDWA